MKNRIYHNIGLFFTHKVHQADVDLIVGYLTPHCNIFLHQSANHGHLHFPVRDLIADPVDLIISIGGDGAFLYAANVATRAQTPIIGIHRGEVGFLNTVKWAHAQQFLEELLKGKKGLQQKRPVLWINQTHLAINELVCMTRHHLSYFKIYVDGQLSHHIRATGCLISTPTGSTAYALSNGGPLVHPDVPAWLIMGIQVHSLKQRAILVLTHSHILIETEYNDKMQYYVDGGVHEMSEPNLRLSPYPHDLLHIMDNTLSYFDILRQKIAW